MYTAEQGLPAKCSPVRYPNATKAILKKLSVGGNISGKKDNRKEGNFYFFLRNTFKYYANAVLMSSTDIKHICFLETKPEINHFWAFVERNILFCI